MRLSWFGIALATASLSLLANHAQAASKETVLHSFGAGVDGITPEGGLISDAAGNLYGITSQGGRASFGGTVFKLAPPAAGKSTWTESVLHSFAGTPEAGLIIDKAGNLYGTTGFGGVPSKKCANGCGTVFKLTPPPAGKAAWTETVLFSFNDIDGSLPAGRLVFDAAGNLYGTTEDGGSLGYGTVFKLTPPAAGKTAWMETVLFSFSDTDGADPQAGLIFDKAGNLYGTTSYGGNVNACPATTGLGAGCGVVFELTPPAHGKSAWTETTVFSLNNTMGNNPLANLLLDAKGDLYGTTFGTASGHGSTVFELMPPAAGKASWKAVVLTSFKGTNGAFADGSLIFDKAGNLYGVTGGGGSSTCRNGGCGTVFKLTPPAAGKTNWTETVLYKFLATGGNPNPPFPQGSLIFDKAGNLYGETEAGGLYSGGTVFKLTP